MATFGATGTLTFGELFGPVSSPHLFGDYGESAVDLVSAFIAVNIKGQQPVTLAGISTVNVKNNYTIILSKEHQ